MSKDSARLYERLALWGDVQGAAHRNVIGVDFDEPFTVGDITVTPMAVDHDVPGACGFLIDAQGKTICYTGDFRFHGFHKELSRDFARRASRAGVDLLICEGTMVSFEDIDMKGLTISEEGKRTEEDLQRELSERAQTADGLLLACFYPRNTERTHRLHETMKAAKRKLVLDAQTADYAATFYPEDSYFVYAGSQGAHPLPAGAKEVTRQEILSSPSSYMLQLPFERLYEAAIYKGVTSAYLHFDGAPLGDYDPAYGKLLSVLEALEIPFERLGVSGHAEPYYLRYMIDTIAPRILTPLHSFRPAQVDSGNVGRRILPAPGETLTL